MVVGRREFEEHRRQDEQFQRDSMADRVDLHREIRDAADEIHALRQDLRMIAKMGMVFLTVLSTLGPLAVLLVNTIRGH